MSPEPQYTRGILGQGCYLRQTLSKPGLLHCRLPALLILQLMDFGRWQFLSCTDVVYIPESLKSEQNCLESLGIRISKDRKDISNRLRPAAQGSADNTLLPAAAPSTSAAEATLGMMPLNVLIDCNWRADATAMEHAITRLGSYPEDALKKRLSRILTTLLHRPGETSTSLHNNSL